MILTKGEKIKPLNNIVFFDGYCMLCNGFVDFLITIDTNNHLKFSSLQGKTAQELLNNNYQMNFSTFVNQFRIDEAKKILSENPDASILNTAYIVGFNSKSAFNRAFLKLTGCTPREFRTKT